MITMELHEEVIKFLEMTGTVIVNGDIRSYIVNNTVYTETNESGLYLVQTVQMNYDEY